MYNIHCISYLFEKLYRTLLSRVYSHRISITDMHTGSSVCVDWFVSKHMSTYESNDKTFSINVNAHLYNPMLNDHLHTRELLSLELCALVMR